jgi:hypothetical protein
MGLKLHQDALHWDLTIPLISCIWPEPPLWFFTEDPLPKHITQGWKRTNRTSVKYIYEFKIWVLSNTTSTCVANQIQRSKSCTGSLGWAGISYIDYFVDMRPEYILLLQIPKQPSDSTGNSSGKIVLVYVLTLSSMYACPQNKLA